MCAAQVCHLLQPDSVAARGSWYLSLPLFLSFFFLTSLVPARPARHSSCIQSRAEQRGREREGERESVTCLCCPLEVVMRRGGTQWSLWERCICVCVCSCVWKRSTNPRTEQGCSVHLIHCQVERDGVCVCVSNKDVQVLVGNNLPGDRKSR